MTNPWLLPSPKARALVILTLKGADSAPFEAVFGGFSLRVGTSDLVQSIEHRVARRFGAQLGVSGE